MTYHVPVLAEEVLKYIEPDQGNIILDCTLGGGGHASLILEKFPDITYYGLDQDMDALNFVKTRINDKRLKLVHGNFSEILSVFNNNEMFDRVLIDLGVSSFQLDEAKRGFSYMHEGPLDMRMNQTKKSLTAYDILKDYDEERLANVIYEYGEERKSRIIAAEVVTIRATKPLETTTELVSLIHDVIFGSYQQKQSSVKRVFQALRIEVNGEISILSEAINDIWSRLRSGGRILIITFHSLEDRVVKNTFKTFLNNGDGLKLTKGALPPKWEEVKTNSRSKSARLRGIQKK